MYAWCFIISFVFFYQRLCVTFWIFSLEREQQVGESKKPNHDSEIERHNLGGANELQINVVIVVNVVLKNDILKILKKSSILRNLIMIKMSRLKLMILRITPRLNMSMLNFLKLVLRIRKNQVWQKECKMKNQIFYNYYKYLYNLIFFEINK